MMKANHPLFDLYLPEGLSWADAASRVTHLGVGAHQDDLEFMALAGILACYRQSHRWFAGVTCTDGGGSARSGPYADFSDEAMIQVRFEEQRQAATIGDYAFVAQLGHPSSVAKASDQRLPLVEDLRQVLEATHPEVVYSHHPLDKHATHVGTFLALLEALRSLPPDSRPERWLGCEVWRNLDWIPDSLKVVEDVGAHPNLAAALNGVFDSQISGGKRYDLAVQGRRLANATFYDSHAVDAASHASFAVDLTPLIQDDSLSVETWTDRMVKALASEIQETLSSVR